MSEGLTAAIILLVAVLAGATASVTGFGIGSLLTPLFATRYGMQTAIAAGGLAGNQGGLRSAALLGFPLAPIAFVATATATGLLVDAARMPVYLWRSGSALVPLATPITVAALGVVAGTLLGERALFGLGRESFRRIVAVIVGVLGLWLLWSAR